MPEYIDKELIRNTLYWEDALTMRGVKIINQFPAADVVEVVRCKDCIDYVKPSGERFGFCVRQDLRVHQKDYCSRGRLKGSRG